MYGLLIFVVNNIVIVHCAFMNDIDCTISYCFLQRVPKHERKLKVDSRFKRMFTDKSFKVKCKHAKCPDVCLVIVTAFHEQIRGKSWAINYLINLLTD